MGSADEVNIQATELNRTMKVCPQHIACVVLHSAFLKSCLKQQLART